MSKPPLRTIYMSQIWGIQQCWDTVVTKSGFTPGPDNYDKERKMLLLKGKKKMWILGRPGIVNTTIRFYDTGMQLYLTEFESFFDHKSHFGICEHNSMLVYGALIAKYKGINMTWTQDPKVIQRSFTITCPANLVALLRDHDEVAKVYGLTPLFSSLQ